MAQIPYRANLQTATFPLLSELSGRSIIVGGQDQNYVIGVSITREGQVPADIGVPQVYYCHNVMPSTYGYQSVGYDLAYTGIDWGGITPSPVNFTSAQLIQGGQIVSSKPVATGFKSYISVPKAGANSVFILDAVTKQWKRVLGAPTVAADTVVTVATVNGVSYIFFSKIGAYIYDNNTNTLIARTLTGLAVNTILGLVSSNGYLFAYSTVAVAWSSVVDVEDFVPSEVSGAGGGNVQETKGEIVTASTTALGLILYTTVNAVSVIYSGNADFPWNFKAIPSSGGVTSPDLVSAEQVGGFQQAYTTNGLQQIGHTGARTIAPQITDFLGGNTFEDYNTQTGEFTVSEFDWVMGKGLAVIADRYVVVSYGLQPDGTAPLNYALVLDVTQNRLGKLKLDHNFAFELRAITANAGEAPRKSIALLQGNGDVRVVNFDFTAPAPDAVLLLGKFQYVRQRMLDLHSAELENIKAGADFDMIALPSLDGKNVTSELPGYLNGAPGLAREYLFDGAIGTNISLMFKGRFNLISLVLWFSPSGRY